LRAGARAPDAPGLDASAGAPMRLFDVFRGPHFTLLGFGAAAREALRAAVAPPGCPLRTCVVLASGAEPTSAEAADACMIDAEGAAAGAYGAGDGALALVRRDGYIGLLHVRPAIADVSAYLRSLGAPPGGTALSPASGGGPGRV